MTKIYDKTQKKRFLIELEKYGVDNATLFVEATTGEEVKMLRKIFRMLVNITNNKVK